jgi:hypothetical protein
MLIWGTANPTGECDETYHGVYLQHKDIDAFVHEICNKPVKVEHAGDPVGKVVHAWKNAQSGLDCIMEVDETNLNGAIISSLVDHQCAKELSLGYRVRLNMSGTEKPATNSKVCLEKEVMEVSIVKRGMRPNCKIHGFCRT